MPCDSRLELTEEEKSLFDVESLLIAGLVASDGAPEDGEERFFWTTSALKIADAFWARLVTHLLDK